MAKKDKTTTNKTIALNRKASHDYTIEKKYEAGIVLEGWEVKSMRAGRLQLKESYIYIKRGELWLFNAHISPLQSASTHINPNPTRTRKLLLHKKEIKTLIGLTERSGYTLVPIACYWKRNRVKLEVGLAKGKKKHDKREAKKSADWKRQQQRILKSKH